MANVRFHDIYDDLKQAILRGDYPYQSYLPSERILTEQYGCSRMTVRRAISALINEGLAQSQQGRGVRVITDTLHEAPRGLDGLETFQEIAKRRGFKLKTVVCIFELLIADEGLSKTTGFPVGSELTRIKRIRYADDVAVGTDNSYYLSSQVPGLTPEIAEDSIYRYLEQDLGMEIATGKRNVRIEHPTREDERLLDLGDYNALAVVRGQTYNADGIVMEYTETKQVPSFFSLHETVFRHNSNA